jgi:hypothetical protein
MIFSGVIGRFWILIIFGWAVEWGERLTGEPEYWLVGGRRCYRLLAIEGLKRKIHWGLTQQLEENSEDRVGTWWVDHLRCRLPVVRSTIAQEWGLDSRSRTQENVGKIFLLKKRKHAVSLSVLRMASRICNRTPAKLFFFRPLLLSPAAVSVSSNRCVSAVTCACSFTFIPKYLCCRAAAADSAEARARLHLS